jgi:surface protein
MNPVLFYEYGKTRKQFVSTWNTSNTSAGSSTSTQVKLPLISTGTYNMTVDWGDGSSSVITTWNQVAVTHTYAVAGTYTIKIKGVCTGFAFVNSGDRLKILTITEWGALRLGTNEGSYFYGCNNLTLTTVKDVLDLSVTTNFTSAFRACNAITTINRINEWNTSVINSMNAVFTSSTLFNSNIGAWNVGNVTTMGSLFASCTAFNNGGSNTINNWNTISVTNMENVFQSAPSFNQPIGNWNTSNVTSMSFMFIGATAFNQNIGTWNIGNVINFVNMFNGATAFNNGGSSAIGNWVFKSTGSIDCGNMFFNASSFNQPVNTWNVNRITKMNGMFRACPFNQSLSSWNTTNCTDMSAMFLSNTAFNQNIGSFITTNVTNFTLMFLGASAFNNGSSSTIGSWNTISATNMAQMFQNATAFNQNIGAWDVRNVLNFSFFMSGKTPATFSTTNLDAIYNGWSALPSVKPSIVITFGTAKRTAASTAGRAILTGAPNNWTITDGGI